LLCCKLLIYFGSGLNVLDFLFLLSRKLFLIFWKRWKRFLRVRAIFCIFEWLICLRYAFETVELLISYSSWIFENLGLFFWIWRWFFMFLEWGGLNTKDVDPRIKCICRDFS
jgi:hypothetical protein